MSITVVKFPNLKVDVPKKAFWHKVAAELARVIRQRTEYDGKDYKGKVFKPYSLSYERYRKRKGRSSKVNLLFTGKMLGSLGAGVSATNKSAKVTLSGREGGKAYLQELQGRVFMAISKKDADKIIKGVADEVARKNKLKK